MTGGTRYTNLNIPSTGSDNFDGHIGELLLYDEALTSTEVAELQTYFTQRWGINLAPTDIALSANTVPEDSPVGTTIGTLSSTDPEDSVFTYSIETGTGGEDNARFTISGNELKLNFVPDYEIPIDVGDTALNNTYTVRIGTNDGNGNTYEESFIITILDTT